MMPNNLDFLLRYSVQENNLKAKNIILESLEKIAYGGIFDHIEGGFLGIQLMRSGIYLISRKCFMITLN